MALLDKVPGDLKLYIGGYVKYTFLLVTCPSRTPLYHPQSRPLTYLA